MIESIKNERIDLVEDIYHNCYLFPKLAKMDRSSIKLDQVIEEY